jgi:hypothetical protein
MPVTATVLRLSARMAITAMPRMPAHLTGTTALAGSPEASSSAPARGSAAAIMDVASMVAAAGADVATTAVAGITVGAVT